MPSIVDVSHDDQYSVEGHLQTVYLRNLKSKAILAKYEGHQYTIGQLVFAKSSHLFASAAHSECLLWNPKDHLKSASIVEVSQPDKILDLAASEEIVQVSLKPISGDAFMAQATTDKSVSIYYTKGSGKASASKTKTVKKECLLKIANPNEQVLFTSLVNETSLNVVFGSVFALRRQQIKLINDEGKVQKEITLTA